MCIGSKNPINYWSCCVLHRWMTQASEWCTLLLSSLSFDWMVPCIRGGIRRSCDDQPHPTSHALHPCCWSSFPAPGKHAHILWGLAVDASPVAAAATAADGCTLLPPKCSAYLSHKWILWRSTCAPPSRTAHLHLGVHPQPLMHCRVLHAQFPLLPSISKVVLFYLLARPMHMHTHTPLSPLPVWMCTIFFHNRCFVRHVILRERDREGGSVCARSF